MRPEMRTLLRVLVAIPVLLVTAWWSLALYFAAPEPDWLQITLAAAFFLGTVIILVWLRPFRFPLVIWAVALGVILLLVEHARAHQRRGLAARRGPPRVGRGERRPPHHPQPAQRRLPRGAGLHRALRGSHLRPLEAPRPRPLHDLLGLTVHRPHHHELAVRCRLASRHLHRDSQEGRAGVLRHRRLLQAVRAHLCGRR